MKDQARTLAAVLVCCLLAGCTGYWQSVVGEAPRQGVSSSLVDYLYPDGGEPPAFDPTVPTLEVPLRVGVAFVPSYSGSDVVSEAFKARLLEQVRTRFAAEDYIGDLVVVPETYLSGRRGFSGLDQISRLYGLDVIALISYDQVALAEDKTSSILYWTIVGAYFIEGSKNDVSTFVDTAVFDVKTRKLLLRAPGVNELSRSSTLVRNPERLREAQQASFEAAMSDMTGNLADELKRFEARIKEDKSVLISDARRGSSGGGSVPAWLVGAALAAFVLARRRRR
jgi:rhombotail lipoprotein